MIRPTVAGTLAALLTLTAGPAFASATDDVRAAMIRFTGLSSYEMAVGKGTRGATIDYVKPNAMHMRSAATEIVRVGGYSYMKMGTNWTKIPDTTGTGPAAIADRVRVMAREAKGITATDLGWKSVGGETLHAYRMKQSDGRQTTVYIGRDGLIHRVDSGDQGGSITFSKFNAIAPIRAPI